MDDDDTPPPLSSLEDQISAITHGAPRVTVSVEGQDDGDALLPIATTTIVGRQAGELTELCDYQLPLGRA